MNFKFIYKICSKKELEDAKNKNQFKGSKKDLDDGFIHFSGEEQVEGTLNKYYLNQKDLILLKSEPDVWSIHQQKKLKLQRIFIKKY